MWDSGKVTKPASCTEKGVKTYTCTKDPSHTKTEDIPPLGHDLKHYAAKAATTAAEGSKEYWYCDRCGRYFSDNAGTKEISKADTVIAKLKDDTKSPQTGDTSSLALWLAMLLISGGAAVIGITAVGRKKKNNR